MPGRLDPRDPQYLDELALMVLAGEAGGPDDTPTRPLTKARVQLGNPNGLCGKCKAPIDDHTENLTACATP